jgi:hypothetical protein
MIVVSSEQLREYEYKTVISYASVMSRSTISEIIRLFESPLAGAMKAGEQRPRRSIMELRGLGREVWRDIDAVGYVRALRDEWENR